MTCQAIAPGPLSGHQSLDQVLQVRWQRAGKGRPRQAVRYFRRQVVCKHLGLCLCPPICCVDLHTKSQDPPSRPQLPYLGAQVQGHADVVLLTPGQRHPDEEHWRTAICTHAAPQQAANLGERRLASSSAFNCLTSRSATIGSSARPSRWWC